MQTVQQYEEIYYGILKAKQNLDLKLMGFWTLYDEISRDPHTFIKVIQNFIHFLFENSYKYKGYIRKIPTKA